MCLIVFTLWSHVVKFNLTKSEQVERLWNGGRTVTYIDFGIARAFSINLVKWTCRNGVLKVAKNAQHAPMFIIIGLWPEI